jgi:erythromycin esterase-like protein
MVRWMREWNSTAPVDRRVQFHGFDIQQPGGAMDTVEAFIGRVDPAKSSFVRARFACFDFYKSYGATWGSSMSVYAIRLATSRAACALGAKEVHDLLAGNAATSSTNNLPAVWSRDSSMAENIRWHRDRAGPGAKMVLWAHNDHIVRAPYMIGKHLQIAYGIDYVPVGFMFGSGTLNAVYAGTVQTVRPDPVPTTWIESAFIMTGKAHLLLDARLIAGGGAVAAPLSGDRTYSPASSMC